VGLERAVGNLRWARVDGAGGSGSCGLSALGDHNWVGGGVNLGAASWAVGYSRSARSDGKNIGDIGRAIGNNCTSEKSGNNGETHLD